MKDYRRLVSRTAPEGLLAYVMDKGKLDTGGLVYEMEWATDTGVDAMLTSPGKKERVVRCTCSECGQSFLMPYAPPCSGGYGRKGSYGFFDYVTQGSERVGDGDGTLCPMCGTPVHVRRAASVGDGRFVTDEYNVMSASVLDGEVGEKPFVLTAWNIRRTVDRYGREVYEKRPLEAYVFEAKSAYKLNGWRKAYSGNAGYFIQVDSAWRQPVNWRETWGQCHDIFGLTPELLEESCLHNSKFDLYMEKDVRDRWKSPVVYLRLYQIYPQVENLIVQGCWHILNSLFSEKMKGYLWNENHRGVITLPEINFEERRPAQMLGLTKEEFAWMKEQGWDMYHWDLFVKAKKAGDRLKLPEDIVTLHQYGGEDLDCLIGKAPLGKAVRYLMKQIETACLMNGADGDFDDVYCDDDVVDAKILDDYWDMAVACGWDLSDPQVRWPEDLLAAHDRALMAREVIKSKLAAKNFKKRFQELQRFAYASGDLMIVPARNQTELTKEGAELHHCVAGYGNDHANGKTAIFFIRHTWAPKTPFYTLEFKEGRVAQNRGNRNCARTPEVEAFEKKWLKWLDAGCPRKKDGTPRGAAPVIKKKPAARKENAGAA